MHPNPLFRRATDTQNVDFIRQRAFGVLAVNGPKGPLTASVPALLSDDATQLEFHLVRTNPIAEILQQESDAVFLFNGPDSYVSPDWYALDDQVPTWNYVAVRVEGRATQVSADRLRPMLDRLSAHFEEQLRPKKPWTSSKVDPDLLHRAMRAIVPCVLSIDQIDATWKLNQNKPEDVQRRTAFALARSGIGLSVEEVARLMLDEG